MTVTAKARFKRRAVLTVLAASVFLGGGAAHSAEKFVFLTNWYAQAEHGGFYQAKAAGLYEQAGLDVDIRMGGPQVNVMQLLLAGDVDAVLGFDIQVLQSVEKGLPVVTVAASFQHDLQGMMAHDDVKTLADVKNKTILVSSGGFASWWPWLKEKYALSEGQVRPYTFNLQPFFVDKAVVQQAYPSSEPFQAQEKGVPVKFFLFADEGYPPYGGIVVTTRKVLASKPDALRRFVKASMEGWKSFMAKPAAGNALIKAQNPQMTDAQIAFGIAQMKTMKSLSGEENLPIGTMTEARWMATYKYLVSAGLLKPETDWRKAYTLDAMPLLTAKAE